MKDKV